MTLIKTIELPNKQFPHLFGYYCIDNKVLYCPAIFTDEEGKRHFSEFVKWAKNNFDVVKFPSLMSWHLMEILKAKGFEFGREYHKEVGENVLVATWKKEKKVEGVKNEC